MADLIVLVTICTLIFRHCESIQEIYNCPVGYCKTIVENDDCPDMPKVDDDHKLNILPPIICNCCDYYLEKLDRGEICSLGDPSGGTPKSICGDGLFCKPRPENEGHGICETLDNTKCGKAQIEWDEKVENGLVGNLEERPTCDRDGEYSPVWCIRGETCYCRNKDGDRIFGTFPYSANVEREVLCDCARKIDVAKKLLSHTNFEPSMFRCSSNGNYDEIQCIDEKQCYCVDARTGQISDADWFGKPVPLEEITKLWCYNKTIHTEEEFDRPCVQKYEELRNFGMEAESMGVTYLGSKVAGCQPDGTYEILQVNSTHKFCINPSTQEQIDDFIVDVGSVLAGSMNCKCAQAREILREHGSTHLPDCCENGNYAQLQCRLNECRCVDQNGNQIVKEVYKENLKNLKCYQENEKLCT